MFQLACHFIAPPPSQASSSRGPSYNSLSQSPMFPISSSSCFIHKNRLWLTFTNGFLFHRCQFSSNLFQYSCLYFFSPHPYSIFAVYLPSNPLLNTLLFSSVSCCFASSLPYFFSNSSTRSLAFLRFSLLSQVSSSTVHPFHHTRYLSLLCTCLLFIIFSTSHSSSPSCNDSNCGCGNPNPNRTLCQSRQRKEKRKINIAFGGIGGS